MANIHLSSHRVFRSVVLAMSFFLAVASRSSIAFFQYSTTRPTSTVVFGWLSSRPIQSSWQLASQNIPGDDQVQSTWNYLPFDSRTKNTTRRTISSWIVPKTIDIPEDKLDFNFVRSSGAGGQNVNKVNTKVDMRFLVREADWIPEEVRERLQQQQATRINKEGYLAIQAQEYRTQAQNRKAAIGKLQEMLLQAWPRPIIRKKRTGVTKAAKERNKEFKRKRSETKANRRQVDY